MEPWQDDAPGREADRLVSRFVCRVGGAPTDGVEALRAHRTMELLGGLAAQDAELAEGRERISALLFPAIGAAADRPARNLLLRLKRDLYNLRPLPAQPLDAACALLPAADATEARAFNAALERRDAALAELERAYGEETAELRGRFRELLRDEDFRKGLLVSSRSLYGSLQRYAAGGGSLSGKEEKTERGMLRYFTRTAMKATPFSTFCAVIPGSFVPAGDADAGGELMRLEGDVGAKRSFARINKVLYGVLLDHLKLRPAVRSALVVEPNPTLRTEAGRLVFLTSVENREVFQRVPPNEVLELILGIFREGDRPTLGALVAALTGDPQIDATTEEADAYLGKLIEIGFLRFHTGIREQDADWDIPFRALLDAMDDDHARQASALLATVRERTEAYATAPVDERAALIEEVHAQVAAALEAMEVKGKIRKDMPFYEDATADASAEVPLTPGVLRAVDTFVEWSRSTSRLAWPRAEQATMRHFFDTYYAEKGARAVPLLQFYEEFYREHFKSHVEKEHKLRAGVSLEEVKGYDVGNPFKLDFIKTQQKARARLAEAIQAKWREAQDAEEVSISLAEVDEALTGVEPQRAVCRSVSSFASIVPGPGGEAAILLQGGSYTAGYGKYFSRFLYMLPDEVVEQVRAENEGLTGELLAEICGDAQFNANLHPPLLRWEISYPTGESGAADEQLRSSALVVEPDPDDAFALCLRHAPTGKRVVPVDLGFLNPRMRPPLYQLLSRFTPPVTFGPSLPESPTAKPRSEMPDETVAAVIGAGSPPEAASPDSPDAPSADAPEAAVSAADAAEVVASPEVASVDEQAGSVDEHAASADGDVPSAERPEDAKPEADDGAAASPDGPASPDAESAEEKPAEPPVISYRPRITVEGRVVLARRRWQVPKELFPQRAADETASAFFIRANRWRMENGLPESSYLRIIPLPDPSQRKPGDAAEADAGQDAAMNAGMDAVPAPEENAEAEEKAPAAEAEAPAEAAAEGEAGPEEKDGEKKPEKPKTAGSRDLHKPQFMDFANPLLVGLLGKMAANLKHYNVVIEERLPDRDALSRLDGKAYATEMVMQVNFPEGTEMDPAQALSGEEEHAAAV
jgi:hypothetical protein